MCSSTRVEHKQTQTCDSDSINKYKNISISQKQSTIFSFCVLNMTEISDNTFNL